MYIYVRAHRERALSPTPSLFPSRCVNQPLDVPHHSAYIDIDGRELEIHGRFITTNDM